MLPRETIATADIPDGETLTLVSHGRDFIIMLGRDELMGTRMQFSEEQLAELTLAELAAPKPRVLIGGYGAAKAVPMLRLSVIALLSSLGQAVTAVALVYTGVSLLHLGRERMISLTEAIMAPVSYGAIACVGLWLFWRGLRHFCATLPSPRDHHHHHHNHHQHDHDGICATCGHAHGPTAEQVRQATTLRETLLLIGSIAVRPCTGALFVLIITLQMGIAGVGIAGAFAMAFGTATITIAVGLGAGALRGGVLAGWASTPRAAQIAALIELAAGLAVALLAGGLLLRAI